MADLARGPEPGDIAFGHVFVHVGEQFDCLRLKAWFARTRLGDHHLRFNRHDQSVGLHEACTLHALSGDTHWSVLFGQVFVTQQDSRFQFGHTLASQQAADDLAVIAVRKQYPHFDVPIWACEPPFRERAELALRVG